MYLLDTDALSLSRDGLDRSQTDRWRNWVETNIENIHLSVVTLMEVRFGIEKLNAKGATNRATELRRWLLAVETMHKGRIVPVSAEIAHKAGELLWSAISRGFSPGSEDALIAASADVNGLVLVSRNGKHMRSLGIDWIDPLEIDPV